MSTNSNTFLGYTREGGGLCFGCHRPFAEHAGERAECPHPVSQPLSRVVAAPARQPAVGDRVRRMDGVEGEVVSIGWDAIGRANAVEVQRSMSTSILTMLDGFAERWTWIDEPAPADVAAFRALTAEQRTALLRIGGDGEALLNAAEMVDRDRGDDDARNLAWSKLHTVLARIGARRS